MSNFVSRSNRRSSGYGGLWANFQALQLLRLRSKTDNHSAVPLLFLAALCLSRMNRTYGNRRIVRKVAIVATALGVWGALVLLFAAPLALTGGVSWREAVSFGGSFWALWLLFLPAVAWLSFRFPIERRRLVRNVALHLLACLLIVGANRAAFRAVARIFPPEQRSERPGRSPVSKTVRPGPPNALGVFFGLRAALDVLVYWSLVGVCQAITNFRSSQERERRAAELEARLTSAKLQALRMQINPHFLFKSPSISSAARGLT